MAKDKIKIPRPDPRYQGMPDLPLRSKAMETGEAMDVRDHPAHSGHKATYQHDGTDLGTETFKSFTDALGPKATYATENRQMGSSIDISESVPRRED